MESACEKCLIYELDHKNLKIRNQVDLPLVYKGISLDCGYHIDLIIEEQVIVELKTVENILPIHEAQLLTYLKLKKLPLGLLLNFNVPALKQGIKRIIND